MLIKKFYEQYVLKGEMNKKYPLKLATVLQLHCLVHGAWFDLRSATIGSLDIKRSSTKPPWTCALTSLVKCNSELRARHIRGVSNDVILQVLRTICYATITYRATEYGHRSGECV